MSLARQRDYWRERAEDAERRAEEAEWTVEFIRKMVGVGADGLDQSSSVVVDAS